MPLTWPVWDAGADGADFVPGFPSYHLPFWETFILREHPNRDQFLSVLRDGVGLHDMLLPPFRGPSVDQPFNSDRFRGAVFRDRIPAAFAGFVDLGDRFLGGTGLYREVVGRARSGGTT